VSRSVPSRAVFSSAPVFELLGDGQDAALSLAIVVGGLRLLEGGHDLTAGAVLALGLFKPQLLALIPVLLFVERRWGALGAWMLVAASLAGLSLALIGRDGVASYRALLESDLYRIGISEGLRWKMQSLPALLEALFPPELRPRGAGLARDALPMAVAATVLVFALYCDRERRGNPRSIKLPFALTLLLDACANPHFLLYDAAILLVPSWILLDSAADDPRLTVALLALYLLLWTAPFRHALMGDLAWPLSVPAASWAAVPTAWLALEAIRRLGRGSVAPG
jgi:alpha-1,2-mannosyltransferase